MNKLPNPFSLYDFLGYFFPGAIVVYLGGLLVGHVDPTLSAPQVYDRFLSMKDPGLILPFVLLAYVSGHLASYLSSVTVERYSTLQYGQPSKYLLGIGHTPYFFSLFSKQQLDIVRVTVGVFMLPVALFDFALGKGLGLARVYARGLDKVLQTVLRQRVVQCLNSIGKPKDIAKDEVNAEVVEFFLLLQHFALANCEHHRPKMDNYVALYGFLRTITFVLVVLAWFSFLHVIVFGSVQYLPYGTPLVVSSFAYVFYMAYMKFWRRYSLEVLMAISVHARS